MMSVCNIVTNGVGIGLKSLLGQVSLAHIPQAGDTLSYQGQTMRVKAIHYHADETPITIQCQPATFGKLNPLPPIGRRSCSSSS